MGTMLLNVSTVDGHWESYFDFEIKAVSFVPALVPWLSNFSTVVEDFFCIFLCLNFSQCAELLLRRLVTRECDSSSVTNISLWYSYTQRVMFRDLVSTHKTRHPSVAHLLFFAL